MNKLLQKGFILTQTATLILTLMSIVLTSNFINPVDKEIIKTQLLSLLSKEQLSQSVNKTVEPIKELIKDPVKTEGVGSIIEDTITNIIQTDSQKYYLGITQGVNGVLSDGIKYQVGIESNYGGWSYGGDTIIFDWKYSIPLSWLIEKNYIPASLLDIPREYKVYICEKSLYLNTHGFLNWSDDSVKTNCETFLTLNPQEQFQFNTDYKNNKGYNYF